MFLDRDSCRRDGMMERIVHVSIDCDTTAGKTNRPVAQLLAEY